MKNFNFKSRKGFTLIELLVVIGILAVLAAIAIPSVAGLIDRANVSTDDTNANEMTNSIERFTSEYELFCQDIASGRFNPNDLDGAQSRVYNVTGASTREDIAKLESADGLKGKQINRDTKYPANITTAKSIVENYTKTSSATYDPKQSDMHFYYSPDCGVVVFGEASTETTVTDTTLITALNENIVSGKDAKGKTLDTTTQWINLTTGSETFKEPEVSNNTMMSFANIQSGNISPKMFGAWANDTTKIVFAQSYDENLNIVDDTSLVTANSGNALDISGTGDGSVVAYRTTEGTEKVLYIAGKDGVVMANENSSAVFAFLPYLKTINFNNSYNTSNATTMAYMFANDVDDGDGFCSLTSLDLSSFDTSNVTDMTAMFYFCGELTYLDLSSFDTSKVKSMDNMFNCCYKVESINLSSFNTTNVEIMNRMFHECYSLKSVNLLSFNTSNVTDMECMFSYCEKLETLDLSSFNTSNVETFEDMFHDTESLKHIYVGDGWTTTGAKITNMFNGCGTSNVETK